MSALRALPVLFLALLAVPFSAAAGEASEAAAAELLQYRMQTSRPDDLKILQSVGQKDVVVVRGGMDHIEVVLRTAGVKHTVIGPGQVASADLHADQILMVNCPGQIPPKGIHRIEKFVRAGGLLYTTDWALGSLIEKAFPKTIAYNGRSTGDHVVAVKVHAKSDDLMSDLLLRRGTEPQWWLEGGSHPIRILDRERVEVLASSAEMKRRYGSSPVVVRFRWHDGEVIHVVSHFYRQVQTRGQAVAAADAVDELGGLTEEQRKSFAAGPASAARLSDVESSYAFQQMTSNLVVGKQKRNEELDDLYDSTPTAEVQLEGRTVRKGDRLRVISREGGKVRVRDDRGNEGELDAASIAAQ